MKPTCSIDGCGSSYRLKRGWCNAHYQRWSKHGDPLGGGPPKYADPEVAFAARTEWQGDCLIWTGWIGGKDGYGRIRSEGKDVLAHRYAWERVHGPIPEGISIDHMLHCDPACCNVDHLREATHAQNISHRAGANINSRTGVRNVMVSRSGKFEVWIKKNYRRHYFGVYSTLEEAAQVAAEARRELFGEYAGSEALE